MSLLTQLEEQIGNVTNLIKQSEQLVSHYHRLESEHQELHITCGNHEALIVELNEEIAALKAQIQTLKAGSHV